MLHADVLVIGGGTAGVVAAVSAARAGADVILVERQGFFGGTMTGVTLGSLCGYFVMDSAAKPSLVMGSLPFEVVERLRACGGAAPEPEPILQSAGIPYDPYPLKRVLDELLIGAGVTLLCHTWVSNAILEAGGSSDGHSEVSRVIGVKAHSPQGSFDLRASVIIDCSGNAVVAAAAGVPHDLRDEPQAPTTMFRFGGVDVAVAKGVTRPRLNELLSAAVADGLDLPRTAGGMFSSRDGIMHVNVTRVSLEDTDDVLDPAALARMEIAGRRQVSLYERAFTNYVPGFQNAFVLDAGTEIGLRESRRIHGEYTLTVDDVRAGRQFDDGIACSAWPVETHGNGRAVSWEWLDPGLFYQIPLRSLIPRAIDGIIVAGRTLSADPLAHASARVAAQCMAMGEAAGILAAQSAQSGTAVRAIPAKNVRRELVSRGAFLGAISTN